jgi:hypothetical protein
MKKILVLGLVLAQTMFADDAPRVCIKNMSNKANLHVVRGGKDGFIQKTKRGLARLRSGLAQNKEECYKLGKDKSTAKITVWYAQKGSKSPIKKVFDLKAGTYEIGMKETKAGFVPFIQSQYPISEIGLKENKAEAAKQKMKNERKMNRKKAADEAAADQN